jgi:hypothetical protein
MIDQDDTSIDLLGLCGIGMLILAMVATPILLSKVLYFVLPRLGIKPTPESFGFFVWLIAATIAVGGALWYYLLGWEPTSKLINRVMRSISGLLH